MEPVLSMRTAVVLLALAALGGLLMAGIRFAGKPHPPTWLAMGHGFIAGAAITLLIYDYFTTGLPGLAQLGLLLFLLAAIGGIVMNLGYHWKQRPLPKWLVVSARAYRGNRLHFAAYRRLALMPVTRKNQP
jgi:hypothetical protein